MHQEISVDIQQKICVIFHQEISFNIHQEIYFTFHQDISFNIHQEICFNFHQEISFYIHQEIKDGKLGAFIWDSSRLEFEAARWSNDNHDDDDDDSDEDDDDDDEEDISVVCLSYWRRNVVLSKTRSQMTEVLYAAKTCQN